MGAAEHLNGEADSELLQTYAKDNVLFVKSAPHEWLFPQCAATVHHGGAGTMAAALRAGKPTVVTPVLFDQFLHGDLVQEQGVGLKLKHLSKVTPAELAAALKR